MRKKCISIVIVEKMLITGDKYAGVELARPCKERREVVRRVSGICRFLLGSRLGRLGKVPRPGSAAALKVAERPHHQSVYQMHHAGHMRCATSCERNSCSLYFHV